MKGREATYRAMIRLLLAFVEGRNTDEQERQYAIAEAHKLLSPSTDSNTYAITQTEGLSGPGSGGPTDARGVSEGGQGPAHPVQGVEAE